MRNRAWIICFAIFMLLLLAEQFRWQRDLSTGSERPYQHIVFYHDRWSGQRWAALYGHFGPSLEQYYTGQEIPLPKAPENVSSIVYIQPDSGAWELRNSLTRIWVLTVGLSFIASAVLFLRSGKP